MPGAALPGAGHLQARHGGVITAGGRQFGPRSVASLVIALPIGGHARAAAPVLPKTAMRMRCSFQRPHRGGSTWRPVVKHQRKPVSEPTDPQVQTPAIRQPNMIKSVHATMLAFRLGKDPGER